MKNVNRHFLKIFFFICLSFSSFLYAGNMPEITFPKDNYTTNISNITIQWNPFNNSNSYRLQIANNITFTSLLLDINTVASQYNYTFPQTGITYYVRVKSNMTGWSDIRKIRIVDVGNSDNILWLDASNVTTVSGNRVSSWTDILHSNIATQASTNYQPTLSNASLLNNLPVIHFDGDPSLPDFLTLSNAVSTQYLDFFIVRNYVNNTNFVQSILSGNVNSIYSAVAILSCGFGIANATGARATSNNLLNTNFSCYETNTQNNYRNNELVDICSAGNIVGFNLTTIGTRPDMLSLAYQGDIAELILFDTIVNDELRTDVSNYLYNKYAPPINLGVDTIVGNSFCDSIILDAGNRFVNYLWSNGSTTQTIRVATNGKYSVKVKDIFGFESTDDIVVSPYRRLNNTTVYLCPGDTFKLDLQTPAGFTAHWNTGLNNTKINITQTGQYTVKVTDAGGCYVYDTINVVVDNPALSPSPNISGQLTVCEGQKLFLTTATVYDSILWSTASTDNFITINIPGNYSVHGVTSTGCRIDKNFNVTIAGKAPTANFTISPSCISSPVSFADSSIVPNGNTIASWKWNFSNGNTANTANTSNVFPSLGMASASLKVTTNVGCTDSISKTFAINKKPIASFYNLLSCSGIPTTFVDQTIPNSASVTDWSWNFGPLGTVDHLQNTGFVFPTPGIYNVTLKATNSNGCTDTITQQTTVNTSPVSNFSFDSACGLTPVTFKFLATVPPPNSIPDVNWGNWDFGDGTIETAIRNPQHVYAAPGAYVVKLIVNSTGQCVDTATKTIKVFNYPNVDFTVSPTQCTGKQIQFTDISSTPDGTPMANWNWYFSGQATDTARNPRYTFNTAGNYTIQLTAQNVVGCSGTKLRSIAVTAPPSPKFTFTPQYGMPPLNVNFTNQSVASGNYIWNYGDGSPVVAAYNPPQHLYTTKGSYPIQLIATDFRGCTDTLTKYILVDKAYVDGAMAAIGITPDGDYYKIQATVINNSNIEITSMGLSLQLGSGAVIRENWTGSLMPGQTIVYVFTGEIKVGDNGQIPVVCASIDNINNNIHEDRTDNNTTCKEVAVGSFSILNIYPNPANDNINFGIMLPKDGKVNIRFIDVLGQALYNKDFDGTKGYNQLTMPVYTLNAAVYVAEVTYDGEVARQKFMVKNKK